MMEYTSKVRTKDSKFWFLRFAAACEFLERSKLNAVILMYKVELDNTTKCVID